MKTKYNKQHKPNDGSNSNSVYTSLRTHHELTFNTSLDLIFNTVVLTFCAMSIPTDKFPRAERESSPDNDYTRTSRINKIYRGDGAVLLDIETRDKDLGENAGNVKLAPDGHVRG